MKNTYFDEINYRFGFGAMRLPMNGEEVDLEETARMVDAFLAAGFNYFDTAHGYIDGKSELALRECLTKRYPRDAYVFANKLTEPFFRKEEDIRPFFQSQLEACGVEYFDFYLMHAQNAEFFEKFKRCRAYETAFALKEEGKIRHVGISFHDRASVLDQILTEYPQIEAVQIQFNYLDMEDPAIECRNCYEVCQKHNTPVIVMEPVKGGSLASLIPGADEIFADLQKKTGSTESQAAFALRFTASFPGNMMILSGMSSLAQMEDNVAVMKDPAPLTDEEKAAAAEITKVYYSKEMIPCTACRYCIEENHCPKKIAIPQLFADMNARKIYGGMAGGWYYMVHTQNAGKASDCVGCGGCEHVCPQKLPIREYLAQVAAEFEKEEA